MCQVQWAYLYDVLKFNFMKVKENIAPHTDINDIKTVSFIYSLILFFIAFIIRLTLFFNKILYHLLIDLYCYKKTGNL